MAYFLRKENRKKGIYLQMYENYWDKQQKQGRHRHVCSFGYVHELVSDEMPDPIKYYIEFVRQKEAERQKRLNDETRPRAFDESIEKNIGYFLIHSLISKLAVKEVTDILASVCKFRFSVYDLLTQLIYSEIINPCATSETVEKVLPLLYKNPLISESQVYNCLSFIGGSYKKYTEMFNVHYGKFYRRKLGRAFFTYTNYFFGKEYSSPFLGQALLMDSNLIPFGMQMNSKNEEKKANTSEIIKDMKKYYSFAGKIVRVADTGSDCASDIYEAVAEANNGYIFSYRGFSREEKESFMPESPDIVFTDYLDADGNLLYWLKSYTGTFDYSFEETDPETRDTKTIAFTVKEMRIIAYTRELAINQQDGLNKTGYTFIVTSEIDLTSEQIYDTYQGLTKIKEYFGNTKSNIVEGSAKDQKEDIIYGHFLISYLSLFLLCVLEIKCFKNKVNADDIIEFIRDFRVAKKDDKSYINLSRNREVNEKIKAVTGIDILDALYLTGQEIDSLFDSALLDT